MMRSASAWLSEHIATIGREPGAPGNLGAKDPGAHWPVTVPRASDLSLPDLAGGTHEASGRRASIQWGRPTFHAEPPVGEQQRRHRRDPPVGEGLLEHGAPARFPSTPAVERWYPHDGR